MEYSCPCRSGRQRTMSPLASISTAARRPHASTSVCASASPTAAPPRCTSRAGTLARTRVRIERLTAQQRLVDWCAENGTPTPSSAASTRGPTGLPLGELRLAGRAAPARRLRRSVAHDAREPARRRQDACASIAATRSRPMRPATCCRPGHCSCAAAASPTATASTVRASRRPRTSSTRTSPRNATRARRSESGATRCSRVVADGRLARRCRAHARRARHGDDGARRARGDESRRRRLR